MPRVGKKHFSYGPAGRAAARKEAKRTGKPLRTPKKPRQMGRKMRK